MAAALVLGGCSARADEGAGGEGGRGAVPVPTSSSVGDPAATTTTAPVPRATVPRGSTATTSASSGAGSRDATPGTTAVSPATTTAAVEADDGRAGPPGAYARTLLRPSPARSLTIEVITEPGADLRSSTTSLAKRTIEDATAKPVTMVATSGPSASSATWDESSIATYADRSSRVSDGGGVAAIRFLALHGGFGPDDNAIGVAVRGDVFAVFVDRVNESGTPLVDAGTVEQAVAVHELGHLLGLVDIALDRNRADPDHPFHSRNRGSVMFWAIDTDLVGQILGGPPPRSFDGDDKADLAALRSGA